MEDVLVEFLKGKTVESVQIHYSEKSLIDGFGLFFTDKSSLALLPQSSQEMSAIIRRSIDSDL